MSMTKATTRDSGREISALVQLRAYLAQQDLPPDSKLPAEREMSRLLGVSRGDLRKAFIVLEEEGLIWRHVGKGTFAGSRPGDSLISLRGVEQRTNPAEIMRTRILLEPVIAREAALHATLEDVQTLRQCLRSSRQSKSWRQYEASDNRLHLSIALATHNSVLIALYEALNSIRRVVHWGQLRRNQIKPPADHHSFSDHEAIVAAISERDREGAASAMQRHLRLVGQRMLDPTPGAHPSARTESKPPALARRADGQD